MTKKTSLMLLAFFIFLAAAPVRGQFVISEFMADNKQTLPDFEDDYNDWIEIHNASTAAAANLGNHFLTDDPNEPDKWQFPNISLNPGAYLIVFASKKDLSNPAEELHANFSLSDGGEYLALVAPDGLSVLDAYAPEYPSQTGDVSYGTLESTGQKRYFVVPTPGAPNDPTPPSADGLLVDATDNSYPDAVRLSWNSIPGVSAYKVHRSETLDGEKIAISDWQDERNHEDTTAAPGVVYYYFAQVSSCSDGNPDGNFSAPDAGRRPSENELEVYKITYKNCDLISVDGPNLEALNATKDITIKIQKLKKLPAGVVLVNGIGVGNPGLLYLRVALIPSIEVSDDLDRFHTDCPIQVLDVKGEIESLTTKACHIEELSAHRYDRVKMTADETVIARTSIEANRSTGQTAVFNLIGVSLERLDIMTQRVDSIKIASKKYVDKTTSETYVSVGEAVGGALDFDRLGVFSVKGGALLPDTLRALGESKTTNISTKAGVYKIGPRGAAKTLRVIPGDIGGKIEIAASKCSIQAKGGDVRPEEVSVSGEITLLSARFKKTRGAQGVEYAGGVMGAAGTTTHTLFVSGVWPQEPRKNIRSVYGAKSVRGIFMAGAVYSPGAAEPFTPNLNGSALKIATAKPGAWNPKPFIAGASWSKTPVVFKGINDRSQFVEYGEADLP